MEKHILIKAFFAVSLITLVSIAAAVPTATDTKTVGSQTAAISVNGQAPAVSNGKIVFVSQRDGNDEIYLMNADGSDVQRLTFDVIGSPKSDASPTWSPDGTRIAFVSNRDGNYEIYVMNADGSNQQRLTSSTSGDINPTWSPDGTRIAFATNRDTSVYNGYEIYVMNTDGSNQQRLTYNTIDDVLPAFSPDGTRIAFSTNRDGNYEIYVMNADGSNQLRRTSNTATDGQPAWSPDGTKIVFVRNFGVYNAEIYVLNASACQECAGTAPTDLSQSPGADTDPAFSPDGTKITFATDRNVTFEIYIMNPDGSEQSRVTNNTASDREPDWQPTSITPLPSISINDVTLTEPNSATRDFVFTVTRTGDTTGVSSVNFATANGTATSPSDYASNSGTLNFADGEITKTVIVVVKNDTIVEPDETFFVNISNCIGCVITDTRGAGTILSGRAVSNGKIAFVSQRDGNDEIYVMDSDGSNQQRLTADVIGSPKHDLNPTWSPDGTRIAFTTDRDGNYEIYVMNADGSNQQRLTSGTSGDINPTWSPDGTRIAFATNRDTGVYNGYEIYVMNTDGSNQQRLTYNTIDDVLPAFSPGGTRIAFATNRDGNYEIYVMNADGSNQLRRTSNTAIDSRPRWSHDGTKILFVRNFGVYNADIYVLNATVCQECAGTAPTYLSQSSSADTDPAFSPDGTKIAFTTDRDGNYEIYTMNPDGSEQTRVTANTASDSDISWQPTSITLLPSISINDVTLTEPNSGTRDFVFTVTRTGDTTGVSSVNFATANGIATSPSDYASNSGTLNFAAGEITKTVIVVVKNDTIVEPDETFFVNISNCIGCVITDTRGAGTILSGRAVSNGKIVFVSQRDGNDEIYVMDSDGSNQQRLTADVIGSPKHDLNPTWSPDGTRIAFTTDRDGNYEIYVMNADGSNQQRLTSGTSGDINPTWSPDGARIAFATNRDTGVYNGYEIYVMNADGSNQQRLTYNTIDDVLPAFSPDGTRIAFSTNRDGNYEIYVMNADGSNQLRRTSNTATDGRPAWSHDGTKILFVRNFGVYNADIYVLNATVCQECIGTPPTDLSQSSSADTDPAFSPDGTKIAFTTNKDGNYEIYIINPDGSEQTRVTMNTASDSDISWQPTSVTPPPPQPPYIIIVSPNGGENWDRSTAHAIKWNYTGTPGTNVKIELLKNGVFIGVINSSTSVGSSGSGSYDWLINSTQILGSDYKIRVTSATNPAYTDTSNDNFTINASITSSINVTSPNGGENWTRGKTQMINWTSTGSPGTYVKIELLKGGVLNRVIIASTPNDGSHSWLIPATQTPGTDYKIRITSTTNASYTDISDNSFTIPAPNITITTPNAGETWRRGTTQTIRWNSSGSPGTYVKIELLKGGVLNRVIIASTPNDGTHPWLIPATQAPGTDYKVRITSTTNAAYNDTSDANFTVPIPSITVVTPNHGENWMRGTKKIITWNSTESPGSYVKIELLKAGVLNRVIIASTINDGSHQWLIPATQTPGNDYKVKITSIINVSNNDTSDDNFVIPAPSFTVVNPYGGENWTRGTTKIIRWNSTESPGTYVKIELLKPGVLNRVIIASTINDGSHSWLIPATLAPGNDYKVKITSTINVSNNDTSDNFTIPAPSITVVSPNGGDIWKRGTTRIINWSSTESPGTYVKIELLKAGVSNRVIVASTINDGSHPWLIPVTQTTGSDYRVKITSTINISNTDTSNSNFTIGS